VDQASTTMARLDALLVDAQVQEGRDAAATSLCELLSSSYGGGPRYAVSRLEMDSVAGRLSQIVRALGVERVDRAARSGDVAAPLRHWLVGLASEPGSLQRVRTPKGDLEVLSGGVRVAALSELVARIELMRFVDGRLEIDARVAPTSLFGDVAFAAEVAGRRIALRPTGEYAGFELFGHVFADGVHLRAVCDGLQDAGAGDVALVATGENEDAACSAPMRLEYGLYSRLSTAKLRYWRAGGLKFVARDTSVGFSRQSRLRLLADETMLVAGLLVSPNAENRSAALTRIAYRCSGWYFRRHPAWLTHDKMYSTGDNGEYMYRYLDEHRAGFVPYYAVNADAPAVLDLRARGYRLVHPGTLRHRLVYLHAEVLFTTHANPAAYNGMAGPSGVSYRDLFPERVVCIQHGLTMQDIARIMHRSLAGIQRYYCASRHEVANLSLPEYGYAPEQLVLTGLPRFDGLRNSPKRRLLLAPTWSPETAGARTGLTERRPASEEFAATPFFRIYAELLTDSRLLSCARDTGYRIDFALHPYLAANAAAVSERLSAGDREAGGQDALVRVVVPGVDASYETLLEESDLMVTDFSGVQYDFAYMGKPVVYFHPDEVPSNYRHGAMDYETMGFGEIATTTRELVTLMCDYMRRDCAVPDLYKARIDSFFEYRDDCNRARILADLMSHIGRELSR
jgi:CDP-glycerol glycerophosphotransferase (TagB/SpsB family)